MEISFIAAIIVLVLMGGFLLVATLRLKEMAGHQMKKKKAKMLGIYDHLLEEKSKQLQQYLKEPFLTFTSQEQNQHSVNTACFVSHPTGAYRDDTFFEAYEEVAVSFVPYAFEKSKEIVNSLQSKQEDNGCKAIRNLLDANLVYQFMTLSNEQVSMLMKQMCEPYPYVSHLWDEYHTHACGIKGFLKMLDDEVMLYDDAIEIHGSHATNEFGMSVSKDEHIAEGYVIRQGTYLYDCSLAKDRRTI